MARLLVQLRKENPDKTIIVGGDVNSFVSPYDQKGQEIAELREFFQQFSYYPASKGISTTCKKRTWLQPQSHKANQGVYECKDQIFCNRPIRNSRIMTIDGLQVDTNVVKGQQHKIKLLPTDMHPFDHYLVVCSIEKQINNDKSKNKTGSK